MIAVEDMTIDTRIYQLLIHQDGEILVEGAFTEDEVEQHIKASGPSTGMKPQRIIMLAILNQGHHSIAGWNIVLHRIYRNN